MPTEREVKAQAQRGAGHERATQGTDRTYFDVVRSISKDPAIHEAVDQAEEREALAEQD
jgi:hypothetical protein